MELITERTKLSKVFQDDRLENIKSKYSISEDVEFIRKGLICEKVESDDEERSVIRYVSTPNLDRDSEIIMPDGVILDDFKKNPVVLFGHQYYDLPIGKDLWIKTDNKGVIAKTQFAKHQLADDVYNLVKEGFMNASSIGFIPVEWIERGEKTWGDYETKLVSDWGISKAEVDAADRIYTKCILLEHSDVPVPSNPEALNLAFSKDIIHSEIMKKAFEIEDDEEELEIIFEPDFEWVSVNGQDIIVEAYQDGGYSIDDDVLDFDEPKEFTEEEAIKILDDKLEKISEKLSDTIKEILAKRLGRV